MKNINSRMFRSLAAGVLFVCLCAFAAPAQAFLPRINATARICVYQAAYDDAGRFIGALPVAEKSLLLRHGKKSDSFDVPGLEGCLVLDEVDTSQSLPTFTMQRVVEGAVTDRRSFRCEKEIAAELVSRTFSCVAGDAPQQWSIGKDLWVCVVVDIREEPCLQGAVLW